MHVFWKTIKSTCYICNCILMELNQNILKKLSEKSIIKKQVFLESLKLFSEFKKTAKESISEIQNGLTKKNHSLETYYKDRNKFEFMIQFAGDILIFQLHTNVFLFPSDHFIFKTKYVKKDPLLAYCSNINIYNFLADSFKYNRYEDLGILIGRIFMNKDKHFFIEGDPNFEKKINPTTMGRDFTNQSFDKKSIRSVIDSAILYGIELDLVMPNFENVSQISLRQIINMKNKLGLATTKNLGYKISKK